MLEENIPGNTESNINNNGFRFNNFGTIRSDASSPIGLNNGYNLITLAISPDSDKTCMNNIDISATEIFGRLRSSSRNRNLTLLFVDNSVRDQRASSRVGLESPIRKNRL